ncbi:MAG: hypothetical protein EXR79_14070 [Myxococcales bacterium]|nr:hypothetical protein [Myxococcales bacterium]
MPGSSAALASAVAAGFADRLLGVLEPVRQAAQHAGGATYARDRNTGSAAGPLGSAWLSKLEGRSSSFADRAGWFAEAGRSRSAVPPTAEVHGMAGATTAGLGAWAGSAGSGGLTGSAGAGELLDASELEVGSAPARTAAPRNDGAPAVARNGAWANAAAAAVRTVAAQAGRVARTAATSAGTSVAGRSSALDFAGLGHAGILAARPGGRADAVTPWLDEKVAQIAAVRSVTRDDGGRWLRADWRSPLLPNDRAGTAQSAEASRGGAATPGDRFSHEELLTLTPGGTDERPAASALQVARARVVAESQRAATRDQGGRRAAAGVSDAQGAGPGTLDVRRAVTGTADTRRASPGALRDLTASARTLSAATAGGTLGAGVGGAAASSRLGAAAIGEFGEPAALRAALQLFGPSVQAGEGSLGQAWLAKWMGRSNWSSATETAATQHAASRLSSAGEMLGLEPERSAASSRGAGGAAQGGASARTGGPGAPTSVRDGTSSLQDSNSVEFKGLAALTALRGPLKTGDDELARLAAFQRSAERNWGPQDRVLHSSGGPERTLRTGDPERALLDPGTPDSTRPAPGAAAATAFATTTTAARGDVRSGRAARSAAKSNAVQLHEFVPTGLRRGRSLLSSGRRAGLLSRVSPRVGGMVGRSGHGGAGYGAAGLGPGELLGLSGADGASFFGDGAPATAAARGADRLSSLVFARRAARLGRGHIAAVAAGTGELLQAPSAGQPEGLGHIPSNFDFSRPAGEFVDPAAAVQRAVTNAGRGRGASATARTIQTGAMARVLSVTASPTDNMLPLVAPAASAIVHAAAAKPLTESIVTSGADASMYMPMQGQSGSKKSGEGGKGGGDRSETPGDHAAQDMDALAQKIARSVMVRIKRERERRGIHG